MKRALLTDSAQILLRLVTIGFLLGLIGLMLPACSDSCETYTSYTYYDPVYVTLSEIRKEVGIEQGRELHNPGKLFVQGNYLFVVESGEGVHLIDNSDKRNPVAKAFLKIPGCYDVAVMGSYLYSDSYVDLLAFNISNPEQPQLINRAKDVFSNRGNHEYYFINDQLIVGYESRIEERVTNSDCDDDYVTVEPIMWAGEGSNGGDVVNAGKGGSMARFTINKGYLYALEAGKMQVFSLVNPSEPSGVNEVSVGWDVETIFPTADKLFLGSRSGMYIFDNQAPASPRLLSIYEHVQACDPVVVQDTLAYVTLRDGTECQTYTNQLEVISISDPMAPELLAVHPMQHPHGLGIDGDKLFIAEGNYGLKVFDASDIYTIGENQLAHYTNVHAFDLIPYQDVVMLIGEDGLYQFDYTDPAELELLSVISIWREDQ